MDVNLQQVVIKCEGAGGRCGWTNAVDLPLVVTTPDQYNQLVTGVDQMNLQAGEHNQRAGHMRLAYNVNSSLVRFDANLGKFVHSLSRALLASIGVREAA